MEYKPHLIAEYLSYLSLMWFFIISVFGRIESFKISSILTIYWVLYCWIFIFNVFDPMSYIEMVSKLTLIDACFALSCTMIITISKTAWKHALLLSFATLCHIMIILSLKNESYGFFYLWYDELIILVGLLQMVISYDGFTRALNRIQGLLCGRNHSSHGYNQSLSIQKKRKAKA